MAQRDGSRGLRGELLYSSIRIEWFKTRRFESIARHGGLDYSAVHCRLVYFTRFDTADIVVSQVKESNKKQTGRVNALVGGVGSMKAPD